MGEHDEFIADFLEECDENLDQLDQELVALEENPRDEARLRSIFRNIHTIKGSSGFFGFVKIGSLSHEGETLLGKLRDGDLGFNSEIASVLLAMSDAIRELLVCIEQSGREGEKDYSDLHEKLVLLSSADAAKGTRQEQSDTKQPDRDELHPEKSDPEESDPEAGSLGGLPDREGNQEQAEIAHAASSLSRAGAVDEQDAAQSAPTAREDGDNRASTLDGTSRDLEASPQVGDHSLTTTNDSATNNSTLGQAISRPVAEASGGDPTSIRVDVRLLDQLMDLAGELVLARNSLNRCGDKVIDPRLASVASRVSQITTDIQDRVTQTRMLPIGSIWGRFRRIVRDLAVDCGKQVRLSLQGEETELDRSLIEAIKDPLTHLIRNSVDHGIEDPAKRLASGKKAEGTVRLHAKQERGQVLIEVVDDGYGIDVDAVLEKAISKNLVSNEDASQLSPQDILQFIFEPGFSTAKKVSALSGRGVGMDVVRSHIEKIGGSVQVTSEVGVGTTFTIHLPLTLAIVPALVLRSKSQLFAVPQASLTEVVNLGESLRVEWIHDVPVCRLRGQLVPLVWLDHLLSGEKVLQETGGDLVSKHGHQIAVLQVDQLRFGLVLDEVMNSQEIVVKPLGGAVKAIGAYSAATILGDGLVALILDVSGIARLAGLSQDLQSRIQEFDSDAKRSNAVPGGSELSSQPDHVLDTITEDSYLICEVAEGREVAIGMDRVERLEEVSIRGLQRFDEHVVTNYRGSVLRVRDLSDWVTVKRKGDSSVPETPGKTPLIICKHLGSKFGVLVKQILDVVNVHGRSDLDSGIAGDSTTERAGGEFALVNGRVVEVLDMQREYQLSLGVGG